MAIYIFCIVVSTVLVQIRLQGNNQSHLKYDMMRTGKFEFTIIVFVLISLVLSLSGLGASPKTVVNIKQSCILFITSFWQFLFIFRHEKLRRFSLKLFRISQLQ